MKEPRFTKRERTEPGGRHATSPGREPRVNERPSPFLSLSFHVNRSTPSTFPPYHGVALLWYSQNNNPTTAAIANVSTTEL